MNDDVYGEIMKIIDARLLNLFRQMDSYSKRKNKWEITLYNQFKHTIREFEYLIRDIERMKNGKKDILEQEGDI